MSDSRHDSRDLSTDCLTPYCDALSFKADKAISHGRNLPRITLCGEVLIRNLPVPRVFAEAPVFNKYFTTEDNPLEAAKQSGVINDPDVRL